MFGCASRASALPSRLKRSVPAGPRSARFRSLTAARPGISTIAALSEPHRPHAAAAEQTFQRIAADGAPASAGVDGQRRRQSFEKALLFDHRLPAQQRRQIVGQELLSVSRIWASRSVRTPSSASSSSSSNGLRTSQRCLSIPAIGSAIVTPVRSRPQAVAQSATLSTSAVLGHTGRPWPGRPG